MAIKLSLLSNKKGINVLTKKKLFVTKREKEKIKAKHTSVLAFKFQLETALLPPLQTVAFLLLHGDTRNWSRHQKVNSF